MELLRILFPEPLLSLQQKPIGYDMRYRPDHTRKPVVVFVHGFKGFKDWGFFDLMADSFAEAGFVFIKLNLSHNGTTPEQPTEFADLEAFANNNFSKEMDDLGCMLDFIHAPDFSLPDEEFDRKRIFLIGHSRGGSLTILKAREDARVKGVVTLAAVADLEKRWSEAELALWKENGVEYIPNVRTGQNMPLNYQIVEDYYQHRDRLHVPQAIQELQVPLLAFHGTADETVPVSMAYMIEKLNPAARIEIIQGANHTFGGSHPYKESTLPTDMAEVVEKTIRFFRQL